ncbi:MAG: diphthine--ammonia ligase [Candidatus Aenigmatarchaeota archaeon]
MKLDVAVLFSGGKDSTKTVEWCLKHHNVKYLLTFFPKNKESYMFHSVTLNASKYVAKAIGIKQKIFPISGEKESEVNEMMDAIEGLKIDALACGGIASNYQKKRFEYVADKLNLKFLAPFWGVNEEEFLREIVNDGYEVIITSVSSLGLGKEWLGRRIDEESIKELLKIKKKFSLNISLEGGEGETLVLDGPIFKKKVRIIDAQDFWDEKTKSGFLVIKKMKLEEK